MSIYGISLSENEHVLVRRRHLEWRIKTLCCLNVSLIDLQTLQKQSAEWKKSIVPLLSLQGMKCLTTYLVILPKRK